MRSWMLKLLGFVLWSAFLFAPFIVRADDGFDTRMTSEVSAQRGGAEQKNVLFTMGGFVFRLDEKDPFKMPLEDKWSLRVNAGRDSVLTNDLPARIRHDRVPLDDGERESLRFGLGLNYSF